MKFRLLKCRWGDGVRRQITTNGFRRETEKLTFIIIVVNATRTTRANENKTDPLYKTLEQTVIIIYCP